MFTSAVEHWSRRSGVSASKLLLPMNYATVLGGMCTLIGTSTNLIVAGLVIQAGLPALSLFDPIWVGFPAMLAGVVYLTTIGHRLLPERRSAIDQATDDTREVRGRDAGRGPGSAGRPQRRRRVAAPPVRFLPDRTRPRWRSDGGGRAGDGAEGERPPGLRRHRGCGGGSCAGSTACAPPPTSCSSSTPPAPSAPWWSLVLSRFLAGDRQDPARGQFPPALLRRRDRHFPRRPPPARQAWRRGAAGRRHPAGRDPAQLPGRAPQFTRLPAGQPDRLATSRCSGGAPSPRSWCWWR